MVDQKWIDMYPELFGPSAKDPDSGNGDIELDDAVTKLFQGINGLGSIGSTWSERHAFITGINIGVTMQSLEYVPCPEFWSREEHYFRSGITIGFMSKKVDPVIVNALLKTMIR
jgi:hypothetical protein